VAITRRIFVLGWDCLEVDIALGIKHYLGNELVKLVKRAG
jgi:hypothetical protein